MPGFNRITVEIVEAYNLLSESENCDCMSAYRGRWLNSSFLHFTYCSIKEKTNVNYYQRGSSVEIHPLPCTLQQRKIFCKREWCKSPAFPSIPKRFLEILRMVHPPFLPLNSKIETAFHCLKKRKKAENIRCQYGRTHSGTVSFIIRLSPGLRPQKFKSKLHVDVTSLLFELRAFFDVYARIIHFVSETWFTRVFVYFLFCLFHRCQSHPVLSL